MLVKQIKLPYDYVSREVDKLYEKDFDSQDTEAISKHCDFIREFINACGWTEEEYIRVMFGFRPLDSSLN
jgi:hypothetical protein